VISRSRHIAVPEFNPESGEWVRLPALQRALGNVADNTLTKWRNRIGKGFEHCERKSPYRGHWVYLPGWLPAWIAARLGESAAADAESEVKNPSAKSQREEIELEIAKIKLARERERVVDVDSFFSDRIAPFCDEIRTGVEHLNRYPEAQRIMVDCLQDGISKLQANGSTQIIDGSGQAGRKDVAAARPTQNPKPPGVRKKVRSAPTATRGIVTSGSR
jgi:hypothetical protein